MLSHLRFHRRAPSNPTSPLPDQSSPWEAAQSQEHHPQASLDPSPHPDSRPRSPNAAKEPPTLPPIARVTSENDSLFDRKSLASQAAPQDPRSPPQPSSKDARPPPQPRPSYGGGQAGFIGGVALQNYRKSLQNGQYVGPDTASTPPSLPESALSRSKPPPPPINTGVSDRPPPVPTKQPRAPSSFVAPTDINSASSQPTGKRPAGTRLATEPPSFAHQSGSSLAPETQKARRSLPFLKNPVSTLLMRRRTGQNASDITPEPLLLQNSEPAYDPRIKGTRVHDFSAPRPRRIVSPPPSRGPPNPMASPESVTGYQVPPPDKRAEVTAPNAPAQRPPERQPSGGARPLQLEPSLQLEPNDGRDAKQASPTAPPIPARSHQRRKSSVERKPVPGQQAQVQDSPPAPPPKDARTASTRTASTKSTKTSEDGSLHELPRKMSSTRSIMSRNASASGRSVRDGVLAALPRHMKSTSSRFSFDMIGAARQEKLMEERHRQRALERKDSDPGPGHRDSRFEDMDEFDYDAMMDDDGLEERIPGVNADAEDDDYLYEEEEIPMIGEEDIPMAGEEEIPMIGRDEALDEDDEMDPDNDQENFAGFVFQRSNPVSELASPMSPTMLDTPRDDSGKVIGFAVTKDSATPGMGNQLAASPVILAEPTKLEQAISGLGIQSPALGVQTSPTLISEFVEKRQQPVVGTQDEAPRPRKDELYYDAGFTDEFADELDFAGEAAPGEPFDESIFDLDDTDRYGRPIPGAFAQAQAQRAAEREAAGAMRESDTISRPSTQSAVSGSTAHTSLSTELNVVVDPVPAALSDDTEKKQPPQASGPDASSAPEAPSPPVVEDEARDKGKERLPVLSSQDAMYQAALAEATQRAALSGKFRRDSSPPPPPTDLLVISPTTASDAPRSGGSEVPPEAFDNDYYEDDPYTQDMDDYDLDDDDIVAEANASALANDSDGWYGQEFGFYSNAPAGHHSGSGNGPSAQNPYEYFNGGYFGPSGSLPIGRSASGRVVSREPNLTPITERSEYSNRNSVMSMGLPDSDAGSGSGSPTLVMGNSTFPPPPTSPSPLLQTTARSQSQSSTARAHIASMLLSSSSPSVVGNTPSPSASISPPEEVPSAATNVAADAAKEHRSK
ncbi:hypothetical protein MAPG_06144 [Magnaporthiopsis poae ATCC 64411]|uniref:AGC-kinase C-terminal domain-containing protein n=1 Tax=Magnaporthiopsis poae (strain ATCC 64411 / 73-15) TaxID=644358 RepID=A0A0C4E190_MAGP6|nr:hypothetical protein MAPG_06144 [Magnaporthiopsis poae ATCC 64411]